MPEELMAGSFRDPSGFLFLREGVLYRQVNPVYQPHYDRLIQSGLYPVLVDAGLLVPHEEVAVAAAAPGAYKILQPERIPFISYPYEWCFSQLKDAALLALRIERLALEHGMTLKDATAYNVQFRRGRPVWIDTLSFETLREGQPWVAYRQFCQHFLAPLALVSYRDARLQQLLRVHLDGVPLELASALLPWRTRFRFGLLSHIHLHAGVERRFRQNELAADGRPPARPQPARAMGRSALLGLVESLESTVSGLRWQPTGTVWADYYRDTNYSLAAAEHKQQIIAELLESRRPQTVWDLGANIGCFSRMASGRGIPTLAFDFDPAAVEKNYLDCKAEGEANLLPLQLDLTNPSAPLGWANRERMSLAERGPADALLALALVHHLAIGNNLPFEHIAAYFAALGRSLLIEFVPKSDSQVQRLLASREDVFTGYAQPAFEQAFARHFRIERAVPIRDSQRILYQMERKQPS